LCIIFFLNVNWLYKKIMKYTTINTVYQQVLFFATQDIMCPIIFQDLIIFKYFAFGISVCHLDISPYK
jgi:hypothetical protein